MKSTESDTLSVTSCDIVVVGDAIFNASFESNLLKYKAAMKQSLPPLRLPDYPHAPIDSVFPFSPTVEDLLLGNLGDVFESILSGDGDTRKLSLFQFEMLNAFIETYSHSSLVRIFIQGEETHPLQAEIRDAHRASLELARQIVASVEHVEILVTIGVDSNLNVFVNGRERHDAGTTEKRRLFALAVLYKTKGRSFSVDEYSALYGNKAHSPNKEFDTNNSHLAGWLGIKRTFWISHVGKRTVACIKWEIKANENSLREFLGMHAAIF